MSDESVAIPHKRERRKEARPGELLEAALDLFVQKGFSATRLDEIAARAGVSKGTLFLYFPSKQELFKALVRETISGRVALGMERVAQYQGSTANLLRELLGHWWQEYGATKASGITKLVLSEARNFPELAQFYQDEVVDPGHRLMAQILQRGIARGEFKNVNVTYAIHALMAPLIFLIIWKHALAPCTTQMDTIDPQTLITQHAELLLGGLLKEPCPS